MAVNLKQLELGPLDSNDDDHIKEYFIHITDFEALLSKSMFFVVGAKGVGKTAIKKYLAEIRKKDGQPVIVLDNNNIINISELKILSNADLKGRFVNFFIAVILINLFETEMISEKDRKYLEKFQDEVPLLKKIISPLIIKTPVFEYSIKELFSPDKKSQSSVLYDKRITSRIIDAIGDKDLWLLIDDVDTLFDTDDPTLIDKCIENMIYSVSDLNLQVFRGKINIVLFLKSEVYERLSRKAEDLDKELQYFLHIRWTNDQLIDLLAKRIKYALNVSETKPALQWWSLIFSNLNQKETKAIQKYVIDRLLNGPRDLLYLIDLTRKNALSNGFSSMDLSHIKEVEFNYGREKLLHISRNFQTTYPDIDKVIERLFRNSTSMFNTPDLETKVGSDLLTNPDARDVFKYLDWVRTSTPFSFIGILYKIGFIGYYDKGLKKYVFSLEKSNPEYSFKTASLMIHKAFHVFLDLSN